MATTDNTHARGKDPSTAGLEFNKIRFGQKYFSMWFLVCT